jgi:hypothetical protein
MPMTRPNDLHMNDPSDKEIHRKEGVDPYPVPKDAEMAGRPQTDRDSTKSDTGLQRGGEEDENGEYVDSVDRMKKELNEEGGVEAWRKGETQNTGAPRR